VTGRRWAFIAAKPFLPPDEDPFAAGLGGTEQAVIHLTTALAELGDTVSVTGATVAPRTLNGVIWHGGPPGEAAPAQADVTVAINDARLLPRGARNPTIWFHNEVELMKEIRRRRLPALLRARPRAVFIGTEQARRAPRLLPFRARAVIPYGLSSRILHAPARTTPPPPTALFTSQAYRGLRDVLGLWQREVAPAIPAAQLTALIAAADVPAYRAIATQPGVTVAPRIANEAVMARLLQTRVLLAPGHVSETFCLAAAEAIALGVPVITLGIGSLKERVRDGIDGFVCRDTAEMAARTRALLTDDALWSRMQRAGIATRAGRSWRDVAGIWRGLEEGKGSVLF
jgi:glycosyltransferase involved in cell wall biosynthesis